MLIAPHAALGAAIGVIVKEPLIVVPAAIASHFVLDAIPHWQETLAPYSLTKRTFIRTPIDIILAVLIVVLISQNATNTWQVLIGAFAGLAPDIDSLLLLKPKLLKAPISKDYWNWHCSVQNETKSIYGLITQLMVIAFSLTVVLV